MKNRKIESLAGSITENPENPSTQSIQFFYSPSDEGVRRNLGRNGSRFGPDAIKAALSKFTNHSTQFQLEFLEVTEQKEERENFEHAQDKSKERLSKLIRNNAQVLKFHLGGGHDHIYPLLMAIHQQEEVEKVLILNIDAHCDTRIDDIHHSGTPFRNLDNGVKKPTKLIQYGIHPFSNAPSTLNELKNIQQELFFFEAVKELSHSFEQIPSKLIKSLREFLSPKTAIVLSLDCDALPGYEFPAVSAPNPRGIPIEHVRKLARLLQEQSQAQSCPYFFGVYEYNPLFDQTSALGAKMIASLIYEHLMLGK